MENPDNASMNFDRINPNLNIQTRSIEMDWEPVNQRQSIFQQQEEAKRRNACKLFMLCNPPKFEGGFDPKITLNWLREINQIFEVCNCEERHKVKCALAMLRGHATEWWDSITTSVSRSDIENLTWDSFSNMIKEKFCTTYDIQMIREEFMHLQKGDMTMNELISQFKDKLRFVRLWVPDEVSQIYHFANTLPPEYRTIIRTAQSLDYAFYLPRSMENDFQEIEKRIKVSEEDLEDKPSGSSSRKFKNDDKENPGNLGKENMEFSGVIDARHHIQGIVHKTLIDVLDVGKWVI